MNLKPALKILLAMFTLCTIVFGAGTPAGTVITNFAIGDYDDANGNAMPTVTSNTVTTIVSQQAGVDISPPALTLTVGTGDTVTFPLTITNTGNGTDNIALAQVTAITGLGSATTVFYADNNGNGIVDGTDAVITSTGNLTADAFRNVIARVINSGALDGDVISVTVTATSQFNSGTTDTATLSATVTASVVTTTMVSSPMDPQPGDYITYAICGNNTGSDSALSVAIIGTIPSNTTYVPGSLRICYSGGCTYDGASILTDAASDDAGTWDGSTVTIIWGDAPAGAAGCVFYQVKVNDNVPFGTSITNSITVTYEDEVGNTYTQIVGETGGGAYVAQYFAVTSTTTTVSASGDPGDIVTFPLNVTNSGNGTDLINLSYTSTILTWNFYWDYNGNGVIDDGDVLLTDTNSDGYIDTGNLVQGQTVHIITIATIPPGTSDGATDILNVTFTSLGDPTATSTSTLTVTVTAPVLSLSKSVTPTGNQPPGTVLEYRVNILNSGSGAATGVIITDAVPVNTTFVDGSMKLNGSSKTDDFDGDGATMNGTAVVFEIPQIGPGGSTYVTFQVAIN